MNSHDIESTSSLSHGAMTVRCACGESFTDTTPEKARRRHRIHHGLATARAALQGEDQPNGS